MYYLFDEERLAAVKAAGEKLKPKHDWNKNLIPIVGKGIDDMTQEEIHESGKKGLGGSTVPDIMGVGFNGINGPLEVYLQKKSDQVKKIDKSTQVLFDIGHFYEPIIFNWIKETLPEGWEVILDKNRYQDAERPYFFADFDALLKAPDGEIFIGEIKSYLPKYGNDKPVSGTFGDGVCKMPHDHYEWQVRYYMREKNVRAAIVFAAPIGALDSNAMTTHILYRDFKKEKYMLNTLDNFWNNNIEKNVPPEIQALEEKTYKTLLEMTEKKFIPGKTETFTPKNGRKFQLLQELITKRDQLTEPLAEKEEEFKKEKKEVDARVRLIDYQIITMMDDNAGIQIEIDGQKRYIDRKNVDRTSVDTEALKKDGLYEKYRKVTSSETFKVSEKKEK